MPKDLTELLSSWPYSPRKISARKFKGRDGRWKVQLRIDLGVLQMEYEGRPDGTKPGGYATLLEWMRHEAMRDENFFLTWEMTEELRQEAIQFYHRYISLYHLRDYPGTIRDTRHNLDLMNFIRSYADPDWSGLVQQYRPHVMMMNFSARALLRLQEGNKLAALELVQRGIQRIRRAYEVYLEMDPPDVTPEIYALIELQHRITDDTAPDHLNGMERLEMELQLALLSENYEQAAYLRDKLQKLQSSRDEKN